MASLLASAWRGAVVVVLALLLLSLTASPAAAHSVGGQGPTSYASTLTSPPDPAPGVTVRLVEAGARLEITSAESELLVRGYDGEPYLRVGPGGVFVNTRSPAAERNTTREVEPSGAAAPGVDPGAPPAWERTSDGPTARWYDARIHADETAPPPDEVAREPDRRHLLEQWSVPVELDGEPVPVAGTLEWVPGPSPLRWWLLVGAAAAAGGATGLLRRPAPVLGVGAVLCVTASALHSAQVALGAAGGPGEQLGAFVVDSLALVPGWAAGLAGAVLLLRGRAVGLYVVAFAGAVVAVLGGLRDIAALSASQLPSAGPPELDRLGVALSLGLGLGLVLAVLLGESRRPGGAAQPSPTGTDPRDESGPESESGASPSDRSSGKGSSTASGSSAGATPSPPTSPGGYAG